MQEPYQWQNNDQGYSVGLPLTHAKRPDHPRRQALEGQYCTLQPLDARKHARQLHDANKLDADGSIWTYLPYGPFAKLTDYQSWLSDSATSIDPIFFTILERETGEAVGLLSYLRVNPAAGSIEVGHICLSPKAQRTRLATEALFLLMSNAFALGYRRFEWKCDALNRGSRAAAERLGLSFEGVFRQATHYKGRNRDTAWFAATDQDWATLKPAFEHWLAQDNFDEAGHQISSLSKLTAPVLHLRFSDWPLASKLP
ncbi:GNAT family N-acetyltransferase [Coralliovum pocilloporae]|uniref:GNAT family N-acetyltransferase n=1 Tax=Coralliovum pocilloporae TaxID=3066369 RepID=UPI003306B1EE